MANPTYIESFEEPEEWVTKWEDVWDSAIKGVGKAARRAGHLAPWWTEECKSAWKAWHDSRTGEAEADMAGHSTEKRHFLASCYSETSQANVLTGHTRWR